MIRSSSLASLRNILISQYFLGISLGQIKKQGSLGGKYSGAQMEERPTHMGSTIKLMFLALVTPNVTSAQDKKPRLMAK